MISAKIQVFSYMRKLKRQIKYETQLKAESSDLSANPTITHVSNGFRGANVSAMLSKRSQKSCEKRHRFKGCKKCTGCRTPNCGLCTSCDDMPCYGGQGTMKQKCLKRVCINPFMQSCPSCTWNTDAL